MKMFRLGLKGLIWVLGVGVLVSCQGSNGEDGAVILKDKVEAYQDQLFQNRNQPLDIAKADSMIMLYKDFASQYPEDSAAVEYLFKAAEVEMGMNKNEDCIGTLSLIQNKYPNHIIMPMVLHFKAFVYDDKFEDFDKARACLDELIQNYPDDKLIENAKAYRDMIGKDPEELFRRADSAQVAI